MGSIKFAGATRMLRQAGEQQRQLISAFIETNPEALVPIIAVPSSSKTLHETLVSIGNGRFSRTKLYFVTSSEKITDSPKVGCPIWSGTFPKWLVRINEILKNLCDNSRL
jgi:hypothetical protein